ncbi:MAG: SPOR domain-containing protein [Treponema sp.]|nr:SPOR domain-containing protein [Treponema sp.]
MKRNIRFRLQRVKIKAILCCTLMFFPALASFVYPQNVESELERLERFVRTTGNDAEKRSHLMRIAKLYRLSGDIEGAANAWQSAAFAGKRNDDCLMAAAFCFAAIGSFDKANANARMVLLTGDACFSAKARFLMAEIEAFNRGDVAPIIALLSDPVYEAYKSVIYYTVWKISGDNVYKMRLLSEYPSSPEALACQDARRVSIFPSPLWILSVRKDDIIPSNQQNNRAEALVLQAGLFSEEANAEALAKKIKQAGFLAEAISKTRNNKHYWAVIVSVGDNINASISRLKALGFDVFPVK